MRESIAHARAHLTAKHYNTRTEDDHRKKFRKNKTTTTELQEIH